MSPDRPHLQDGEFDLVLAEAHELVGSSAMCFMCALRDTLDRRVTARWLAVRRSSRGGALGIACCPRHGWRLWELASAGEPRGDETARFGQVLVTRMVTDALSTVLRALVEVQSRLQRGSWLPGWRERRPPDVLWERSACVLCPPMSDDATLLIPLIERECETLNAEERLELVRSLCPRDRVLGFPARRQWPEFAPQAHRTATTWSGWWELPERGASESSFVWRLIRPPVGTSIPDTMCPACWVRAEHERLLLRALLRWCEGPGPGAEPRVAYQRAAEEGLTALGDDICGRHLALGLQAPSDAPGRPLVGEARFGDALFPPRWPIGTLRRDPETRRCVVCAALHGWDLARLEGLRRGAGSATLSEEITEALRPALARRTHGLCLPHWIATTASAPAIVTETLLDYQLTGVHALCAALEHDGAAPHRRESREVASPEAYAAAIAALAGYPT